MFTDIIGKPVFIKLPLSPNKIVKLSDISEIYVDSDENNISLAKTALKYNNNIDSLHLIGDHIENIDFIDNDNAITNLVSECKISSWDSIKKCCNLNVLKLTNSNFYDFDLLSSMNQLSFCEIESSETIKYCDFNCFKNLTHLSLNVPNVDIACISAAPKLNDLTINNADTIVNYNGTSSISSIETLNIINSDIDTDIVLLLAHMNIEDLYIKDCTLNGSEADKEKLIKEISSSFIVEYENRLLQVQTK